jgi:hypothetical protein
MTKKKYTATPNAEFKDWEFVPDPDEVFEIIHSAPITHTMGEGENILTVAKRYLPEGMTRSEYATQLVKTNGSFEVGRVIHLV